jgi:hypothetical protein
MQTLEKAYFPVPFRPYVLVDSSLVLDRGQIDENLTPKENEIVKDFVRRTFLAGQFLRVYFEYQMQLIVVNAEENINLLGLVKNLKNNPLVQLLNNYKPPVTTVMLGNFCYDVAGAISGRLGRWKLNDNSSERFILTPIGNSPPRPRKIDLTVYSIEDFLKTINS